MLTSIRNFKKPLVFTTPGTGGNSSVLALRCSPKRSDQTQMT